MAKFIIFITTFFLALFIIVVMTGFYPVAIVEGTPIFQRTWRKAEDAAKNFIKAEAVKSGKAIDLSSSENADFLLEVKRGTLTFLIEDLILQKEGGKVIDGFERLNKERVDTALREGENLEQASRLVYGLDLKDFVSLVLLPQARRDVLQEALGEKAQDFNVWFLSVKKSKQVRLMFIPFRWDGEVVR